MKVMQREETVWGLIQDVLRMAVEGKITEQKNGISRQIWSRCM